MSSFFTNKLDILYDSNYLLLGFGGLLSLPFPEGFPVVLGLPPFPFAIFIYI
jgi:hypothetical protein